ncbi:hypothetical protein O5552_07170 [Escherichia coli]|nr:hypothetical protein [Escherichia coli]
MDLYSRRIVGWQVDNRMTSSLVCRALMKAYNLRNRKRRLSTVWSRIQVPVT